MIDPQTQILIDQAGIQAQNYCTTHYTPGTNKWAQCVVTYGTTRQGDERPTLEDKITEYWLNSDGGFNLATVRKNPCLLSLSGVSDLTSVHFIQIGANQTSTSSNSQLLRNGAIEGETKTFGTFDDFKTWLDGLLENRK